MFWCFLKEFLNTTNMIVILNCSACYTLRYVSDPNSDSSYDVANELLWPVLPKPLDDRQVNEDEAPPLLPVHWRENVSTDRLGDQVHKEVLYLQEERNKHKN